jgi:hypothetical protein
MSRTWLSVFWAEMPSIVLFTVKTGLILVVSFLRALGEKLCCAAVARQRVSAISRLIGPAADRRFGAIDGMFAADRS